MRSRIWFLAMILSFFTCVGQSGIAGENAESSRIKIKPFELSQVRLLDSPFKDAQDKDAKYLLSVNPDALLAKFRINAGLEAKAKHYDGWEKDSISGHSLGHYLSAVTMMYAATGNERFKERTGYIVDQLEECQKAGKDGLVSAIPNDRKVFAEIKRGEIRSQGFDLNGLWVPWYTLHKLFAGLIDAYHYCDNEKALETAKKLGDWAIDVTKDLTDEQFAQMMRCEFGGMNDVLYQLSRITGEDKYRKLADRFYDAVILEPFAEGRDDLPGKHGNTQFPKVIGLAQSYELTGNEKHRKITEFFWDCVVNHHTYVTGGNTMNEHFGPPDKLNDRLDGNTTETCNTYNMLKMTRHLYTWTGDTKYLDYYERGLFNHILASIDRSDDMNRLFTYFVPLRSGGFRTYSTAFDNWTCCHGTGMENHAKYGDSIYFHAEENGKDVLYVNLLIPSVLDWKEKGIEITIASDHKVTVKAEKSTNMVVKIRIPGNCRVMKKETPKAVQSDGYFVYDQTWEGTKLLDDYVMILSLHVESMPDNKNRIAFFWGPTLLAGNLGAIDKPMAAPFEPTGDAKVSLPCIVGEFDLNKFFTEKGNLKTLPEPIRIVPFFAATERYAVYFDVFTEEEWKQREAEYKAGQARLQAMERLTVDFFQPGEMQPERDHNFRGEKTAFGEAFGRKWRHAVDGGSMTFEMKLNPDKQNKLVFTYWGSDGGNRVFDILVNGKKIAEQRLDNNAPDKFFDVGYLLDGEVFRELDKITVTLQARPGATAGGFFGCRTMIVEK
ncbi:MAG: glycoside hydrolase family 127 protein [Planctomycetaceae bacterium]|nr:glycoside hydrolase family 127 protein [Planctomycetaceae bacterium]